jgi:hypothetical protein
MEAGVHLRKDWEGGARTEKEVFSTEWTLARDSMKSKRKAARQKEKGRDI